MQLVTMKVAPRGQVVINDTDLRPVVSICSIIFVVAAVLSVAGRVFTRVAISKKPANDNYAILIALVSHSRS